MKITTVLLDAGGIILDESDHERVRADIIVETLRETIPGYSKSDYHSDVEEAIILFAPRVYQYVFWKNSKDDLDKFDKLYHLHLEKWKRLRPPLKLSSGIESELKSISKYFDLGIAGQYGGEIIDLLEKNSLLDYFTCHLTQDDFSLTKPDPRYYEQIVQRFGVFPQQCIMVGDRIDNDIIPAKKLGMRTVLVQVGIHKNQKPRIPFEIPDLELNSVSGLAQAILKVAEM